MPGIDIKDRQRRCVLPFEALPSEVRLLRRAAAAQLGQWGVPTACDAAQLVVTELATNVIKHVGEGSPATLILEWKRERLRVEMHDKSSALPSVRTEGCDAECGRGLHMLAAMTVDWGSVVTAMGKAVWCEIELGPEVACRRVERAVLMLEMYHSVDGAPRDALVSRREAGLREAAVGLISDLLHWTVSCGFDPDDVLDQAQMHYEAVPDVAA